MVFRYKNVRYPIQQFRNEMDRLFDTFVREPFGAIDWPSVSQERWTPVIDIAEGDEDVIVRAELPGIDPKDLDVSISGNQLVLTGEKKESAEDEGKDFYHSEARYGVFRRSVPLPEDIDCEDVDAKFVNGVLTLRLKKSQPATPKRIKVKIED